ncbi:MAG: hypothetical protein JXB48_08270 [Candidatus Latescibacteria bacterium]|nr:hypothetical protein [Candidatus Latescibacterota bacterium]
MIKKALTIYLSIYLIVGGFLAVRSAGAQDDRVYTLAVLDLEPNQVSLGEAKGLSDKLRSEMSQLISRGANLKAKYDLLERTQIDKILDQFEIQNIGCVSDSCAVEFGKMLQTDRILVGSVSLIGETYSVIARIVDVASSKTVASADRQLRGSIDDVMVGLLGEVASELLLVPVKKKSNKKWYILAGVVVAAGAGAAAMGGGSGGGGETPVVNLPFPPDRP